MASSFASLVAVLEQHAMHGKQEKEKPVPMVEILQAMKEADSPVTPRELAQLLERTYHNTRWWM